MIRAEGKNVILWFVLVLVAYIIWSATLGGSFGWFIGHYSYSTPMPTWTAMRGTVHTPSPEQAAQMNLEFSRHMKEINWLIW
ncbi:MAG: hypothetical protein HY077_00375 [Elusimicrobia bacterium]|nr:hypothetical protein [Elusimicrobiota bacterium]